MKTMLINVDLITYCGQPMKVSCDRNCGKAWGVNQRPNVVLDDSNEEDFAYLADGELGEAPADPGTYEGDHAKPESPDDFPNKWCVRECERCSSSKPGESDKPLGIQDFSARVYNIPRPRV